MAMTSIFDEEIEIVSDLDGGSYISAPIFDEGLKPAGLKVLDSSNYGMIREPNYDYMKKPTMSKATLLGKIRCRI